MAMQKQTGAIYTFLSLFLVIIIDTMGFAIVMPILAPLFTDAHSTMLPAGSSINLRDFYYGLVMAVFFIFTFFGAPFMGDLSDQIGRRKVLLICLAGVAVGYIISAVGVLCHSLLLLLSGRALCGFAAGSQPIAQAAIIDISDEKNKTLNLAWITFASCIGFVIGPLLSGYSAGLFLKGWAGYATPFFIAAILAAINGISLYFTVKETGAIGVKHRPGLLRAFLTLKSAIAIKSIQRLSIIFLLYEMAWGIYFQYISLFMAKRFFYTPSKIGFFMSGIGVVAAITITGIIRLFMGVMGLRSIIISNFLLMIAGLLIIIFFKTELAQWIAAVPLTIGLMMCYTAFLTLFSDRVDQKSQGMAMGISASLGSLAWIICGLSLGVLTAVSDTFPFIAALVLIILGLGLFVMDRR